MHRRWRILHLTAAVAETSGQYNEHCLPLLDQRDLAICSFHAPVVEPPPDLPCYTGHGSSLGYLRALGRALGAGHGYDLVHAHSARAGVLFLLAALLRPRLLARTVYTVQNSYRNYHLGNRLLLAPIFLAYRRIVMCSAACRDSMPGWLLRLGGSRVRVVQNAVNVERVVRAVTRGRARRRADRFTVACVGRIIEIKNPFTVVDAFARVAGDEWALRFIGAGALTDAVLSDANSRGLGDRVETTGLVPRDDVFEKIGAADLFVSASRGEGLPVAVLESMACGCPVILSDIPPHRELADGAGFIPLVATEDAAGFAREMDRFRRMPAAEREAIGADCRRHVEQRFGLTTMHDAYDRVYREVCGSPADPPVDDVALEVRR